MPASLKKMVLLPRPRRLTPRGGGLVLPATGRIVCAGDAAQLLPLAVQVQGDLAQLQQLHWELGAGQGGMVRIGLQRGLPAQGYRLDIGERGMDLAAADLAGTRYGVQTLRQLLRQCQGALPLRQGTLGRSAVKRRLAEDLRVILGEHRRLWVARNREGGLQDSARRLETRLAEYTS